MSDGFKGWDNFWDAVNKSQESANAGKSDGGPGRYFDYSRTGADRDVYAGSYEQGAEARQTAQNEQLNTIDGRSSGQDSGDSWCTSCCGQLSWEQLQYFLLQPKRMDAL